jgi:hypothetical protein
MTDARSVTDNVPSTENDGKNTVVVVGKESVGKSELVAGLSGTTPTIGNFRGTTVDIERYESDEFVFVDTPGILLGTDTETTRTAISAVEETETVLLVVRATNIDDDLEDLLPLVQGKVGAIAVTFWDKVENQPEARSKLNALADDLGVPLAPVDARTVSRVATDGGGSAIDGSDRNQLVSALRDADEFPGQINRETGIHLDPPETVLEHSLFGPLVSIALLLLPAAAAVHFANAAAAELSPRVGTLLEPAVQWANALPGPLAAVLGGSYGLLSMGPFLFVWAGPTILILAVEPVRESSAWDENPPNQIHRVVRRLVRRAKEHVQIETVLCDREFDSQRVFQTLSNLGVNYLIPKRVNSTERDVIETMEADGQAVAVESASVHIESGSHSMQFLYVPSTKRDGTAVFSTNLRVGPKEDESFCRRYSRRWQIENGYKSIKNDFLAKTSSKDYRVRLFYFVFAVLLHNIWRLTDFLLKAGVSSVIDYAPVLTAGECVELVCSALIPPD